MDVCTERLISTAKIQLCISFKIPCSIMFFFELSTFSNKHTNKQKITSGCSWHIIVIHSGQIECFLCHDYFWVASLQLIVPPNIASIISQNQTPSVTQRLSDIRSCSAFALLSIWLQIPPKTLYHYPLCLLLYGVPYWDTIQQAPVINWWYLLIFSSFTKNTYSAHF